MILLLRASGRLARQGLTELFFESAEPPFDELPPTGFFRRFPEGSTRSRPGPTEKDRGRSRAQPRTGGSGG